GLDHAGGSGSHAARRGMTHRAGPGGAASGPTPQRRQLMAVRPSDLHAIPLFNGITDDHLAELIGAFERLSIEADQTLFQAAAAPTHLLLLVSGEVALHDPGANGVPRFRLSPIAPIGELGAVTGLRRSTTAVTTQPSEIWRIGVAELTQFFEKH